MSSVDPIAECIRFRLEVLECKAKLARVEAFGLELESSGVEQRENIGRELAGLLAGGVWHTSAVPAVSGDKP